MHKGILLYAFNNEIIDYVRLAAYTAELTRAKMPYPICLVTDEESHKDFDAFDYVVKLNLGEINNERDYPGFGRKANFRNHARMYSDILTPFERTLVLDVDYLVLTDHLKQAIEATENKFMAPSRIRDFYGMPVSDRLSRISDTGLEVYWATAMVFSKCAFTTEVFSLMRHVADRWHYFTRLYRLPNSQYRNDFALTIALHHMRGLSGHTYWPEMDTYAFALKESVSVRAGNSFMMLSNDLVNSVVPTRDIHLLDKSGLCKLAGALL